MALPDYEMSVASTPSNYRRLDGLLQKLRTDPGLRILRHAKAHLWTDWLNEAVENGSAIDFLEEFILRYANDNELISDSGCSETLEESLSPASTASMNASLAAEPLTTFSDSPVAEWPTELPVFAVELHSSAPPLTLHRIEEKKPEPMAGVRVLVIGGPETLIAEEEAILASLGAAVASVRSFSEAIGRMLRNPADLMLMNEPTVDGWRSQNMAVWLEQNRPDWLNRMLFTNSVTHAVTDGPTKIHCMLQPFSSAEFLDCVAAMGLVPFTPTARSVDTAMTMAADA